MKKPRPLHVIAREIRADLINSTKNGSLKEAREKFYNAWGYLDAMDTLDDIGEDYGYDSGYSIVAYGLSNLTTWRGDTARRIKAELRGIMQAYNERRTA